MRKSERENGCVRGIGDVLSNHVLLYFQTIFKKKKIFFF